MDKEISKKYLLKIKLLTPKFFKYSYNKSYLILKNIKKKLGFPVVIKPLNEGSSVNVFICNQINLKKKLGKLKVYKKN